MAAAIPMEVERELSPPPVVWTDVTAEAGVGDSLWGASAAFAAVRERVGPHVTVGCRMLGDEVIEGGTRVDDAAWFVDEDPVVDEQVGCR